MTTEAIDAAHREVGSDIVPAKPAAALTEWTPRFAVAVDDAINRKQEKRRFFESVMDEGLHYGVIPGTKTKPTLLKPGAEMLLSNMGLTQELCDAEAPIRDYDGTGAGNGERLIGYRRVCRIYRQTGPLEHERMLISQAEGFCSSREEKYRYRTSSRTCPQCGGAFIIKGKAEYGGGWLCFKKKGGCGAKFDDGDAAIVSQPEGKVLNPNVADVENTILKMADKRALVAATLLATGCSDIFTQDVEDNAPGGAEPAAAAYGESAASDSEVIAAQKGRNAAASKRNDAIADDPVRKGNALEACRAARRKYFFSDALYAQMLLDLFPQHASPVTNTVSEADLSIDDLALFWKALERKGRAVHQSVAERDANLHEEEPL